MHEGQWFWQNNSFSLICPFRWRRRHLAHKMCGQCSCRSACTFPQCDIRSKLFADMSMKPYSTYLQTVYLLVKTARINIFYRSSIVGTAVIAYVYFHKVGVHWWYMQDLTFLWPKPIKNHLASSTQISNLNYMFFGNIHHLVPPPPPSCFGIQTLYSTYKLVGIDSNQHLIIIWYTLFFSHCSTKILRYSLYYLLGYNHWFCWDNLIAQIQSTKNYTIIYFFSAAYLNREEYILRLEFYHETGARSPSLF